jgi:hypothetical protein
VSAPHCVMAGPCSVLELRAPNTTVGVGRRAYVVVHPEVGAVAVVKDDGRGPSCLADLGLERTTPGFSVKVSATEYLDAVKRGKRLSEIFKVSRV